MLVLKGSCCELPDPYMIKSLGDIKDNIKHSFSDDDESFHPLSLEINGRENRRTCVIVEQDCRRIKVFDLDVIVSE